MRTEIMVVTPELAAEWLHRNGNNRPFSQARGRLFERELKTGQAKLTHQGIALDTTGAVQDGQHRLQAIVNTGIPWEMAVTFDAPVENFNVIDRGGGRSLADLMAIRGYRDKNSVAVATLAWQWERGQVSFMGNPRDTDLAEFFERYPVVAHIAKITQSEVAPPKQLSFVNLIADDEDFTRILVTDGPDQTKPAGMLGLLWRTRRKQKVRSDLKLEFAQFVKARNDHEHGRSPNKKYTLKQTEGFPQPEWKPPIPFDIRDTEDDD
jgi:hypothetical protein